MSWRDHVVMLAGATGRFGQSLARAVLADGGRVAAAVRRPWQVAVVQQALGRERVLVGHVAAQDAEAAAGFVKGSRDALGPITTFVGAAGAFAERAPEREPAGDLAAMLEANLLANATLARAVSLTPQERQHGALLFVGAGDLALAGGSSTFVASKLALLGFVHALATDTAATGLHVGALLPNRVAPLAESDVEALVAALPQLLLPASRELASGGALLSVVD
jgi:3-hydroxybutyrate dehydrogenase